MPEQQTITAFSAQTKAFRSYTEDADCIVIQPATFGPPPTFTIYFGKYVPAVPAKPAIPNSGALDLPDTPATPEVPPAFKPQRSETLTLTQDEWDNWDKKMTDNAYLTTIALKRFGLSPA